MSVALIGSSGGGTATLGHTDGAKLLSLINQEISKVEDVMNGHSPRLVRALFASLHGGKGFDHANYETDEATLYSIDSSNSIEIENHVKVIKSGLLQDVNSYCTTLDKELAGSIRRGDVQGLICISCDVTIHAATLQAAADMNIPVTGSGGTSLSVASSKFGIRLVGNAGGSVATTSYTRAVSYTFALATAWGALYKPHTSDSRQFPQWRSLLDACLPVFWAVVVGCRGIELISPHLFSDNDKLWIEIHILELIRKHAIPTTCCVIMTTSMAPQYESIALMSASIASVVCQSSILGGLLAGWIVAWSLDSVLHRCLIWNIPATMTSLLLAGGVGMVTGVLISPLIPYTQLITEWIRWGVHFPMDGSYPGLGFLIGILFCYGSKVGYYHSLFLPVILIEMELGLPSLWGTIDMVTLVLVSAGICSGNLLVPPLEKNNSNNESVKEEEIIPLCSRGLRSNLLFGDFIEVAYPFMEKSQLVNIIGYLASGLATEVLTGNSRDVLSSAYLPFLISILLANDWFKISLAYATAYFVSFLGTVINNILFYRMDFSNIHKSKNQ